jgi:hypothetical protein
VGKHESKYPSGTQSPIEGLDSEKSKERFADFVELLFKPLETNPNDDGLSFFGFH